MKSGVINKLITRTQWNNPNPQSHPLSSATIPKISLLSTELTPFKNNLIPSPNIRTKPITVRPGSNLQPSWNSSKSRIKLFSGKIKIHTKNPPNPKIHHALQARPFKQTNQPHKYLTSSKKFRKTFVNNNNLCSLLHFWVTFLAKGPAIKSLMQKICKWKNPNNFMITKISKFSDNPATMTIFLWTERIIEISRAAKSLIKKITIFPWLKGWITGFCPNKHFMKNSWTKVWEWIQTLSFIGTSLL